MTPDAIVTLSGVRKTYGAFTAIENLDLSIRRGEFVTLLGPSGCGKTTTLRLVAGFERPDAGRVTIAGEDVTAVPPFRRAVNTVFQDYALFPHMTVAENVGYGLSVRSNRVPAAEREPRIREALAMVGLADLGGRRPWELSGGQRQRVAMARALVRRPQVLLLDEPLSALDVKLRQSMQVELKHLHQKVGITFVMVTHDQEEALVLSDRVVVMKSGRIVQQGTPQDLYDRPASPYVADFIGSANLFTGKVVAAEGGRVRVGFPGGGVLDGVGVGALRTGDAATVAIRPERLRPALDGAGIPATVAAHLFHGGNLMIEAGTPHASRPVFVAIQRSGAAAMRDLPAPGAAVVLAPTSADDVLVYAEAAA
ncbi:ABC transporter ATP-binding protein [Oharaeibacter diazotrophicus]|uniref:Spermidine/putrescine transport system ATP-binding protein n=1 Tax=Oharaeibacter diazotrophicus TaxID=1920512 RepID=A0A4R6RD89_9HYPH|nr:ABC transporter ATP-binding protein [Oharaeibacter diazotrophicus]TDP84211.1 spermidine/putrescine transport system ATP-binding protein [Oharaeibacter diazotrophicus]BBE73249.1 spermidine/putrescine import ATP-binding protein PotA [Pleomorphomonas sp. SM30]GLS75040.1 polyamine-transporting ATPase [Oharaeibacter diazotrophicus]